MKLGGAIEAHPTQWIADEALGSSLRVGDESFTVKEGRCESRAQTDEHKQDRSEAERDTSVAGITLNARSVVTPPSAGSPRAPAAPRCADRSNGPI
jgi:hypothetical protein